MLGGSPVRAVLLRRGLLFPRYSIVRPCQPAMIQSTSVRAASTWQSNCRVASRIPQLKTSQARSLLTNAAHTTPQGASVRKPSRIQILYASQTGTAQLFAMQLAEGIVDTNVDICSLCDFDLQEMNDPDTWYILIVSTAGVGEAPDNGRAFHEALKQSSHHPIQYSIFALGNSRAHASHYCAFGKALRECMHAGGAVEILPMSCGDDGDCVEDDFDQWQEVFLKRLYQNDEISQEITATASKTAKSIEPLRSKKSRPSQNPKLQYGSRHVGTPASDLLERAPKFYAEGARKYSIKHNAVIRSDSTDAATNPSALRELQISTGDDTYVTGDHLLVYPRNSDVLVEAYLNVLGDSPDPHAIIEGSVESDVKAYPHPVGITVYETLRHCVDLQALPSPSFARYLAGTARELDYKGDIATPRRTVLELLLTTDEPPITLQDLLYQLAPMQPRYYSIASSNLVHPNTVYLTYRPIKYTTSRGIVREGTATSYLSGIPEVGSQTIVAALRSNPLFRLPATAHGSTPPPILLIAGGCGVAPIRAFLEELVWNARQPKPKLYGPVHLFLGFRNPDDAVYSELLLEAELLGLLAYTRVTYTTGCPHCALVSDAVVGHGGSMYKLLKQPDTVTYICGGARTFGVAIRNAIQQVLQTEGDMSESDATAHLQTMIESGRFHEDLSD